MNPEQIAEALADYAAKHFNPDDIVDEPMQDVLSDGWFFEFTKGETIYTVLVTTQAMDGAL